MKPDDIAAYLTAEQWKTYKTKLEYLKLRKYRNISHGSIAEAETIAKTLESLAERNRLIADREWMPATDDCVLLVDDPQDPVLRCPFCWNTKNEGHAPDCAWAACIAGLPREV